MSVKDTMLDHQFWMRHAIFYAGRPALKALDLRLPRVAILRSRDSPGDPLWLPKSYKVILIMSSAYDRMRNRIDATNNKSIGVCRNIKSFVIVGVLPQRLLGVLPFLAALHEG